MPYQCIPAAPSNRPHRTEATFCQSSRTINSIETARAIIDTDTLLPAPPCQSSNGEWRLSSRELQHHSLLQPSRAWRICVNTGSHPRWRLIHNVAKSRRFCLTADGCVRIHKKQPPLPPTGAIPWSRQRRADGYRGDAMGGNIHPVASNLPAASSFNSK